MGIIGSLGFGEDIFGDSTALSLLLEIHQKVALLKGMSVF